LGRRGRRWSTWGLIIFYCRWSLWSRRLEWSRRRWSTWWLNIFYCRWSKRSRRLGWRRRWSSWWYSCPGSCCRDMVLST